MNSTPRPPLIRECVVKVRPGDVAASAAALAVLGVLGWGLWVFLAPAPEVDRARVRSLAAAGRFDEAEARVASVLQARPNDPEALWLGAQVAVDRAAQLAASAPIPSEAAARRALERLARIKPEGPGKAALVALFRGKALYYLARLDDAERAWVAALELDPTVPEAAWGLLDLYYFQGRTADARGLALRQVEVEPDPRDRVKLLLELVRQDYQRLVPAAIVDWYAPRVRRNPADLHAALALGRGLVLDSKTDDGLRRLRQAVATHSDSPDAWDALLTGLDDGGAPFDEFVEAVSRLPANFAGQPRFARHLGRVANGQRDWDAAVRAYRRAAAFDPGDSGVRYRLCRALMNAGETAEAARLTRTHQAAQAAIKDLKSLYEEAEADPALGTRPHPDLYRRLADLRERRGLRDEAAAWHRLVLRDAPDDPESRAALQKLGAP